MTALRKLRRRRFVWFSALSFGTLFSLATFGLGADGFDSMLVSLGLRTTISTEESAVYRFGEIDVSVSEIYAENLPAKGTSYVSVQAATINDQKVSVRQEGRFINVGNQGATNGTFIQGWVKDPRLDGASEVQFCNVTARYAWGIPVYHYDVGVSYAAFNFEPLIPDAHLVNPYVRHARKIALEEGWDGSGGTMSGFVPSSRFIDSGTTLDWAYCDNLGLHTSE